MKQYLDLLQHILDNGIQKGDRTGTGTISTFGYQMRFDLSMNFPLLTTKKMFLKGIIHELLWLISGDTNIQYLKDHNVKIWDSWADENGDLGPVYGQMWRKWPWIVLENDKDYIPEKRVLFTGSGIEIDQLKDVIGAIKRNPNSRRHIVTAWNPALVDQMALPPCHCFFQFYVEPYSWEQRVNIWKGRGPIQPVSDGEYSVDIDGWPSDQKITELPGGNTPDISDEEYINGKMDRLGVPKGKLSCQLYQRSADVFLGVPFNIASYALLTMMIAQVCDLEPGEFVHTFGDVHIYNNHIEQVKLQLTRNPLPGPKMIINPNVKNIDDFKYEDFELVDYHHHPAIKGEVSV